MKKKLWLVACASLLIILNSYGQKNEKLKEHDSLDAKGNVVGHISYGIAVPYTSPDTLTKPLSNTKKFLEIDYFPYGNVDGPYSNIDGPPYTRGIKDTSGKLILPAVFKQIEIKGNYFIATLGIYKILYDSTFTTVPLHDYTLIDKTILKDYFIVRSNTKTNDTLGVGLIDKNRDVILPAKYAEVCNIIFNKVNENANNGSNANKENKKGTHQFDKYVMVKSKSNKYAIFNTETRQFSTGFNIDNYKVKEFALLLKSDSKYKFVDSNLQPFFKESFDTIIDFEKIPSIIVQCNGKMGMIGVNGQYILPVEYDTIQQVITSRSIVGFINKKKGQYKFSDWVGHPLLNDSTFTLLKPIEFKHPGYLDYTYLAGRKNGKMGTYDERGRILVPFIYDTLYRNLHYYSYLASKNGKWGVISRLNDVILPIEYQFRDCINKQYAVIEKDNKLGVFDSKNEKLLHPCDCDVVAPDGKPAHSILCIRNNELITIHLMENEKLK